MTDIKAHTHICFALKREGRGIGRWLEIGVARQDNTGVIHLSLDRTPIGGFNGYAYLAPLGSRPPTPEPERPMQSRDDEDL